MLITGRIFYAPTGRILSEMESHFFFFFYYHVTGVRVSDIQYSG